MATLNGFIRSYGAAIRRAEREQKRENRDLAKRFKDQQKHQEIQNAQQAVSDWEKYVSALQSLHKNCTNSIDWNQVKKSDRPTEPTPEFKNELVARRKLEEFKPSIFDRLFGASDKKIGKLKELLEQSKIKDAKSNGVKHNEYLEELSDWGKLQEISDGIGRRDPDSFKEALHYFDPFSDISELGTQINFNIESNRIDIDLHVNSTEVIPDYELKQTSTGKLSKKGMPKTRFNELYQDHICSASIRLAREVFAYLPIEYARVNAMAKMVNSKNGHQEDQPILSVIFTPSTIKSLNLNKIDPSDSMQNFLYEMDFNKTKGFSSVTKVEFIK